MILVNTDFVSGKEVWTIQVVKGSVVQSKHPGKDIIAGFSMIVDGELGTDGLLIEEGAKLSARNNDGSTALTYSSIFSHISYQFSKIDSCTFTTSLKSSSLKWV